MAAFVSRISFSRKPNSKVYNHNPAGFGCYGKDTCDPDLILEPNHRTPKTSYAPSINQLPYKSPLPNGRGYSGSSFGRNMHGNTCSESGGSKKHSILNSHCVHKAEETTQTLNGCLKVAEEMTEGASRVLVNLHQQGEQIMRTNQTAASIDHNLRRGEKLLGSLGGLFAKKWKPKKAREINGPILSILTKDYSLPRKGHQMEQRQKLGLTPPRSQWNPPRFRSEPSPASKGVELEKAKQDDALSDLSDLLGKLKVMAVDMGSEIDRQNKSLDHLQVDVDGLNIRMKDASIRARHLLRR